MSINALQRFELKKFIKQLEEYRGRHTELVSVYIPAGYDINKINTHLSQEAGTASNIKSTSTRKNVTDALEKMLQHLKLYKQTPPNGLAAFAGNVAEREGQSDVRAWSIEPPIPLKIRLYRCDKAFVTDILSDMIQIKESYGLVVMDRREGDIALLRGKTIVPLSSASSNVPGKTRAGGQSAHRYERLREDAAKDFYKKIAAMMKDEFLGKEGLKGVIVGGPGPTKYSFVEGGFITNDVQKKIIGIKDLSYTGPFGLQELLDKSEDLLANEEVQEEKNIMNRFFKILSTEQDLVSYGEFHVKHCLELGAVEVLLLSESLDEAKIEEMELLAQKFGTTIVIISVETREGAQLKDIGKIAAILRYKVTQ